MTKVTPATVLVAATAVGLALVGYSAAPHESLAASFATSLHGRNFGQRHNALMAVRRLDGALIRAGAEFSFNARVGSYSSDQGFRKAPVSYNGQLIDDWGGGVCQASTTLYNAALLAGMEIVERNRHQFCPSYVAPGRDAAVAYRWVDLRFRNPYPFAVRLHALIDRDTVRMDFLSPKPLPEKPEVVENVLQRTAPSTFYTGRNGRSAHVRNSGKPGYEVVVYRIMGNRREIVSEDEYPAMNRLVERSLGRSDR